MNVIVSNVQRNVLSGLDIDVIKSITGEYDANELVEMFKNFFYNKMILDVTAIKDFHNIKNFQIIAMGLDVEKIVFFLPEGTDVCTSNFLSKLVYYQKRNPQIKLLSPLIYYYEDKDRIWNAGGKIIWGVRKYFYSDHLAKNISVNEYLSCSFITGCALMFVPDILKGDHTLFTEAFFHGEEDFELSLRMKKKRVKMGCYTPSVIYHKVGRSSGSVGKKIGLTYCYYLNRFINLRHNLSFLSFYSFLCVYLPYVVRLLHKNNLSYIESFRFYFKVVAESHKLDEVTHEKFMECVKKTCI